MWIDDQFPLLAAEGYEITSEPTRRYNCIGYAAGDTSSWWTYFAGYRWPNATRTPFIQSLIELFEGLQFERCEDAGLEVGFQKVALYAKGVFWKHAAVQLPSGEWSSKLGRKEDIKHRTPDSLNSVSYGSVYCIMRRRIAEDLDSAEPTVG